MTDADLDRLARTLLGEAANQGPEGQAAVGWVVRNRMADTRWPGDVGGVAVPGQFSAWNTDGTGNDLVNTGPPRRGYAAAMDVARAVLDGTIDDPTGGATHYFTGPRPYWYDEQAALGGPRQIGAHTFLGSVAGGPPASAPPAAEAPVAQQANPYSLSGGLSAGGAAPQIAASASTLPQDDRSGIRRLYDWMGDDGLLSGLVTGAGLMIGGDRAMPMLDPYAGAYGETEQRQRMQQALAMLPQLDPQTAALVQAAVAAGQPDAAFKMAAAALQKTGESFTLGEGDVRFGPDGREIARGPSKAADGPGGADAERLRKARVDAAERVVRRMDALPADATPDQRQAAYAQARAVVSSFADVTGIPEAYSSEGYAAIQGMFADAKGSEAGSPVGKLRADLDAGRITPEDFARATNTVPDGYRQTQGGGLEFIPGGPADPAVRAAQRGKGGQMVLDPATGNPIFIQGDVSEDVLALGRPAQGEAQKDILSGLDNIGRINRVNDLLGDPRAAGVFSDVQDARSYVARMWERNVGDLGDESRDFLQYRARVNSQVNQLFNTYRKEITGAAAAQAELDQLKEDLFSTGVSLPEFVAKFEEFENTVRRNLQIKKAALRGGLDRASIVAEIDSAASGGITLENLANSRFVELKQQNPSASDDDIFDMLVEEGF